MSERGKGGGGSFGAAERRLLAEALARGEPLACPGCGGRLTERDVRPGAGVPYVRRRVWVLCPVCGRGAALDRPPPG